MKRPRLQPIVEFLRTEAGSGVVLLMAIALALVWANGPWARTYEEAWGLAVGIGDTSLHLHSSLRHWINDAAMVLFFLVVGLEISRELRIGELRDPRAAALPVIAAVGGMAIPVLVYLAFNPSGASAGGWAIPMATDIAFAVGILAVLGPRAPSGLHVFLLSLAIVDDIGAIVVIAAAYTDAVELTWIAVAIMAVVAFSMVGRPPRVGWLVLLPIGVVAWYATLRSGIHPTIAGVALGIFAPVQRNPSFVDLEGRLHRYSSYLVVPLFALANAGVALNGSALRDAIGSRIFWGVVAGLVVGKLVGITVPSAIAIRLGIARLPSGARGYHLVGAGALGGIGFTVALFITALAFDEGTPADIAKAGVLAGSATSAVVGAAIIRWGTDRRRNADVPDTEPLC